MTIHGNLKSPGYAKVIEWLSKTWEDFDSATIVESFKKCGITAHHDDNLHSALRQIIEKSEIFKDYVRDYSETDEFDGFNPDVPHIFEDGLFEDEKEIDVAVLDEDEDEDDEDPTFEISSNEDSSSSDETDEDLGDVDKELGNVDEELSEDDVEKAFIDGKHKKIIDPVEDYEREKAVNKRVKEKLSQMGYSPRTLRNKQQQSRRDLETKLIAKCAKQKMLTRPPATKPATDNPKSGKRGSRVGSTQRDTTLPTTSAAVIGEENETRGGSGSKRGGKGGSGSKRGGKCGFKR